jgi:hypothetical protein
MSAAAGLSAARRRRAGSNNSNTTNRNTTNRNTTNRNTVVKKQSNSSIHPMKILEHHERRLRDIEINISQSDSVLNNIKKNENRIDNSLVNDLNKRISSLASEVNNLKMFTIESNTLLLRLQTKLEDLTLTDKDLHDIENIVSDENADKVADVSSSVDNVIVSVSETSEKNVANGETDQDKTNNTGQEEVKMTIVEKK